MPFALANGGLEPIGFSNTYNGGYADLMRLTAAVCLKVPNGLDARRAAMTEPMAVGLHAVNKSGIKPEEGALVLGCGPVGLAVIAALKARGIGPIVASDFSARRRAMAVDMGAHEVVTPTTESAIDAWRRVGKPMQQVVLFEAIGVPGHHRPGDARRAVRRAGSSSSASAWRRTTCCRWSGSSRSSTCSSCSGTTRWSSRRRCSTIAEGELDVTPMITGIVGVDGVPGAFDALANPEEQVKILVEPGAPASISPA